MVSEYILDLSVRPSETQIEKFGRDIKKIDLEQRRLPLPFWDVRTGDIKWGDIGQTFGALLLKPGQEYKLLMLKYQNDSEKYSNLPQNIVNYCINHRLAALANLNDPKIDVGFEKLASQYYHGVFIDKEIPEHLFVEMFCVAEMNNDPKLERMYSLTSAERLKLIREKTVPISHKEELGMYTDLYLNEGILSTQDFDDIMEWIKHLISNNEVDYVIDYLEDVDVEIFQKVIDYLSVEDVSNIAEEMIGYRFINSKDKHHIIREKLSQ